MAVNLAGDVPFRSIDRSVASPARRTNGQAGWLACLPACLPADGPTGSPACFGLPSKRLDRPVAYRQTTISLTQSVGQIEQRSVQRFPSCCLSWRIIPTLYLPRFERLRHTPHCGFNRICRSMTTRSREDSKLDVLSRSAAAPFVRRFSRKTGTISK